MIRRPKIRPNDIAHPATDSSPVEFANNQPVTYEVVEMSDMLLELVSTIHIIVVGIVADDDTRVLHHVLDEAEAWNLRIRKSLIGVYY